MLMRNALMGIKHENGNNLFRYIKFEFTSNWGGSGYFQLAEIEVSQNGGENIALLKSVYSPNPYYSDFYPEHITDGLTATVLDSRWIITLSDMPAIAIIDLESYVGANTIKIIGSSTAPTRSPKNFSVSVSVDNSAWDTVFSGQTSQSMMTTTPFSEVFSW